MEIETYQGGALNTSHTLMQGDCLELMKYIPDESVDLVLTDPPYGVSGKGKSFNEEWDKFNSNEYADFSRKWIEQVYRVLKNNGSLVFSISYHYSHILRLLIEGGTITLKGKEIRFPKYFNLMHQLIWKKTNAPPFAKKYFNYTHEIILWYCKGDQPCFDGEYAKKFLQEFEIANGLQDVLTLSSYSKDRIHPAQKPYKLFSLMMNSMTKLGDTVLDPFAGSGTTGEVAMNSGRNCILIEKEARYYKDLKKRLVGQESLYPYKKIFTSPNSIKFRKI
jgi:site-specific DNA-methyltransferase (adenine-specific)